MKELTGLKVKTKLYIKISVPLLLPKNKQTPTKQNNNNIPTAIGFKNSNHDIFVSQNTN